MRPTVNREREVEIDEARLTRLLLAGLCGVGCVLYFGVWIGTAMYARASAPELSTAAAHELPTVRERRPSEPLPAGFIGPPSLPYPPTVGGGAGLGGRATVAYALEVEGFSAAAVAERSRRRLLARGYPAYVLGPSGPAAPLIWLRIGDYSTEAEASLAGEVLRTHEGIAAAIVRRDERAASDPDSP